MKQYKIWLDRFMAHDLPDFTLTEEGLLWLKLRSIERKTLLKAFSSQIGVKSQGGSKALVHALWKRINADEKIRTALDCFLKECQKSENRRIDDTFEGIRSNLYRMKEFRWGGGFRNSLDKAIVSRYVKTEDIIPYDRLEKICGEELMAMSRGYLLNSWYDYWSSVLIENIFRRNAKVVPAPGKIKNVDFFVDDVPFDLKVTYFPKEFCKLQMRAQGLELPLARLKKFAKTNKIPFARDADEDDQRYELEQRIADSGCADGRRLLDSIRSDTVRIVNQAADNPKDLVRWLYENQGEMRFGAENRIFLILVDMEDLQSSWKLKRNVDLIEPSVNRWLRSFGRERLRDFETNFVFKGRSYSAFADAVFIGKAGSMSKPSPGVRGGKEKK